MQPPTPQSGLQSNTTNSLGLHTLLTVLTVGVLAACGGGDAGTPLGEGARIELPPPLAETQPAETPPEAPPIDPERWRLPDPAGDPPHPPWLKLVWSQDNRAELEACGCPGSPTGGMARRATFAGELRAVVPDVLLVEGPTALSRAVLGFETVEGPHRARGRVVLEALAASRPDAFFPGQADFAVVPPDELAAAARRHGLPIVVTNLEGAAHDWRRSLLREVDGRRVLLLGLVRGAGTQGLTERAPATDAVAAAAAEVAAATAEGAGLDLVIALTDADNRTLRGWLDAGLDADVVLAPPDPGDERTQYVDGGTLVVRAEPLGRAYRRLDVVLSGAPGTRAVARRDGTAWPLERVATLEKQYLGRRRHLDLLRAREAAGDDPRVRAVGGDGVERVDPSTDPDTVQASLAEVVALRRQAVEGASTLPGTAHEVGVSKIVIEPQAVEDPAVQALIDRFSAARLAELQAVAVDPGEVSRDDRYAGREACVACHPGPTAHWTQSPHARAWKTLIERGEDRNPECLACHTTGFARAGGFADPGDERALLNVQCEACHGPRAVHAEEAERVGFAPPPGAAVGEAVCLRCHDEANSPRFDHRAYLPRIAHPESR